VAGYREAFAITDDIDPIGPVPPAGRPDARAWWERAAAALDGRSPASLASVPDERLEALVEEVRREELSAPEPAAERLRAAAVELRAARTAEGLATAGGDTLAVVDARERVTQLTAMLAETEVVQGRRAAWRLATGRAHAQAAAAEAELAARRSARAAQPFAEMSTDALERQARATERRVGTASRVVVRCDARRAEAERDVAEASTELDALQERPATTAARATVAAEQLEAVRSNERAERIEELASVLGRKRLGINVVRGHQRAELTDELTARLAAGPADVALHGLRWAKLLRDGAAADDAAVVRATRRLAQALPGVDEMAAIGTTARLEERDLRGSAWRLRAELDRRTSTPAGPGPGGKTRAPESTVRERATPAGPRPHDLHRSAELVEGPQLSDGPVLAP